MKAWMLDRWETLFTSPIVLRELRSLFRKRSFFVSHLVLLVILGIVTFSVSVAMSASNYVPGAAMFVGTYVAAATMIFLILPAFACTSITQEKEQRSFDLIITSTLGAFDLVWGKIVAVINVGLVILISTLPLSGLSFLYGGVEISNILAAYAILVMEIVFVATYGVYTSSVSGNSRKSITSCYLALLLVFSFCWFFFHAFALTWIFGGDLIDMDIDIGEYGWRWFLPIFLLAYLPFLTLLVLSSINRLKPPQANRSTPLRIFYVVLLTCWLGYGAYALVAWPPTKGPGAVIGFPLGFVALISLFMIIAMSLEDARPSPRVLREGRRWASWKRWIRFFHPAHVPGPGFTLFSMFFAVCLTVVLYSNALDWSKNHNDTMFVLRIMAVVYMQLLWLNALCRFLRLHMSKTMGVVFFILALVGTLLLTSIPYIMHTSDWKAKQTDSLINEISIAANPFLSSTHAEVEKRANQPKILPIDYWQLNVIGYLALFLCLEIVGRAGFIRDRQRYVTALEDKGLL